MNKNLWSKIKENEQYLNEAWFGAWENSIKKISNWQGNVRYDLVECNNEKIAIIPNAIQTKGPFKFISLVGNIYPQRGLPNSGADNDLIENTANKISKILKDEGFRASGFRMSPVIQDEFIEKLKDTLLRKKWKFISKKLGHNHGFKLLSSEEEYLATLSSKRKYKLRRCLKGMNSDGVVELKHYNDIPEDQWAEIFKKVELIEGTSWIVEKGNPKFIGTTNQLFWNSLITDDWFRRSLNVWILYFNEKPVSYSVDIDTKYTRYGIGTGYDKEVSKYRTGAIILMATIVNAIESGKKVFDAGLGDGGGYKTEFGAERLDPVFDIVAFPPTLSGRAAYYAGISMNLIGKLKKIIRR